VYHLPKKYRRHDSKPVCIGQRQRWFLLQLQADEHMINLHRSPEPEFDDWQWVDFWYPVGEVVSFKRHVYQTVLDEFAKVLSYNTDMV
jgi:putative (di)nucleoside polyphosphate hydrolase